MKLATGCPAWALAYFLPAHFAGASLAFWIAFHATVAVLLGVDLVFLRNSTRLATAWAWTAVVATVAFCFALFVSAEQGHGRAVDFVSGYLVEGSLSVDNLFVFLLLFRSIGLGQREQRRVLLWGVLGAIVLRGLCIFAGVSLLSHFHFIEYIFGVVLLAAGLRLLRGKAGSEEESEQPAPLRWLRGRIGAQPGHALTGSSFLLVVLAVELTDLLFAFDSIPAVLAITRDPFIVYTSNIFAILGLRSLYFALAAVLDRLRLLHYGLALILLFVAGKMLLSDWITLPAWLSLVVILAILFGFGMAGRFWPGPGTSNA